jgi:hypothetical protein
MFVVWKGWGILTILIVAVVSGLVTLGLSVALAATGLPKLEFAAMAIGLFVAAAANWYAGKYFNSGPGRELFDPKTGQTVILKRRHDLFFIKMEYWSVPVAIIGLFVLFAYFTGK